MKKILCIFLFLVADLALAQKISFIVNAANPLSSISEQKLQDFYYKKVKQWPDGSAIRFFDRAEDSQERMRFLEAFLGKTPRQVDQYWIGQKLYSGSSSPSQVGSDRMVANLVARFPGSISYVKENFALPSGVKVLNVTRE